MLKGEPEFEEELEEESLFELAPKEEKPKEVVYNPQIPIETFDFIVTDECHRSIYNLWRLYLNISMLSSSDLQQLLPNRLWVFSTRTLLWNTVMSGQWQMV
jgi:hypothetical protein